MVQGDKSFLHVGSGAHLGGAADQYPHLAVANFLEQHLLLGVGIGFADGGDLLVRDAAGDQFLDDLVVERNNPRSSGSRPYRRRPFAFRVSGRSLPHSSDVFDQPIDLRFWEIRRMRLKHAGIEGELAAIGGDRQGIVFPWIDLLRADPVVAFDQILLKLALLIRHRAGNDDRLCRLQTRTREV